jgi:hypothetical protein
MTLSGAKFAHWRRIWRGAAPRFRIFVAKKEQGLGLIRAKRLSPPTFYFKAFLFLGFKTYF